jgi:hypothetical protein
MSDSSPPTHQPERSSNLDQLDQELTHHILDRARKANPADPDVQAAFVTNEFGRRLAISRRHFFRWRRVQFGAVLLVAMLGALAAVAAAVQQGGSSVVAIVAGALVTALTAVIGAGQPGVRSQRNNQRRVQVRQEGWDYLLSIGSYRAMDQTDAWKTFAERVQAIAKETRGGVQS